MSSARAFAMIALFGVLSLVTFACGNGTQTAETSDTVKVTPGSTKAGSKAPDFDLRNQEQLRISLSEFKGKKNVVLVFYPADFTPV